MISANTIGDIPQIDSGSFVDPSARIVGNVHVSAGCYIGPFAVVRADEVGSDGKVAPICIGQETNIQDGVIVHALSGTKVTIGKRCSIAHGAIIHGPCTIGDGSFVGFRAVVHSSDLGGEVFVGTSAVVQCVEIPDGSLVGPAEAILSEYDVKQSVGKTTAAERGFMHNVVKVNLSLVEGYGK